MKRMFCAGWFLTVAVLQGCATAPSSSAIDQLTKQATAWDKAIVAKDRAAIEANMSDDFRQIGGNGEVETKRSFVDDRVAPDLQIDPYTVEEFEVRVYGDAALLTGRMRISGRYQGKPIAGHYRYTDIYVRRDGRWKVVSVQLTRMPK